MAKNIVQEFVDIFSYPKQLANTSEHPADVSIGDLHSNAIKLLFFLVRQSIYAISASDYDQFVGIYRNFGKTTIKKDLAAFKQIIKSKLCILDPNIHFRLLGDELADRGVNDYFILKILEKFHKDGASYEILLSNHSVEFIEGYEKFVERKRFQNSLLDTKKLSRSFTNLAELVNKRFLHSSEILNIIEDAYKPKLKVIGYSLDKTTKGISIYSHAGIDIHCIKLLVDRFNNKGYKIAFRDDTSFELASTIETINQAFSDFVKTNQVHALLNYDVMRTLYRNEKVTPSKENILEFILWNRCYESLKRTPMHKGYQVCYVHGHDTETVNELKHVYGLDSDLGKRHKISTGEYLTLITDECQLNAFSPTSSSFSRVPSTDSNDSRINEDYEKLKEHLSLLAFKRDELLIRNEQKAYCAAKDLYNGLVKAAEVYFEQNKQTEETYGYFKTVCTALIETAKQELEKHRGCKKILGNILIAILTLGVGYIVAVGLNKTINGKFLFFSGTDSLQKVNAIQNVVLNVGRRNKDISPPFSPFGRT